MRLTGGSVARRRLICLLLSLAMAPLAQAQVVIYRCTDASGAVTMQNGTPCPKGSTEVKRAVEAAPSQSRAQFLSGSTTPAPAPAAVAPVASSPVTTASAPATPVPAQVTTDPAPPATDRGLRTPPPPLFECRTWEGRRYLGDDAQPPPRCIPVAVTGLDGTNATAAAGSACQMVDDQCQAVPDALLCQGWTQRLNDVESQSVGGGDNRAYAQAEAKRLRAIIDGSSCAAP